MTQKLHLKCSFCGNTNNADRGYCWHCRTWLHAICEDVSNTLSGEQLSKHASGSNPIAGALIAFPQNLSATQCASTEEVSPVLQEKNPTAVCFQPRYFTRDNKTGGAPSDISPPLCAAESNRSNPQPGDPCHPLASSAHTPAVAFTERSRADGRNFECQEDVSYALTNPGSGGRTHSRQIATQSSVRRLTPTECESLQGFPDGYTAGQSDSARYRQLGNAVAVPVAAWIARRLMTVIKS